MTNFVGLYLEKRHVFGHGVSTRFLHSTSAGSELIGSQPGKLFDAKSGLGPRFSKYRYPWNSKEEEVTPSQPVYRRLSMVMT